MSSRPPARPTALSGGRRPVVRSLGRSAGRAVGRARCLRVVTVRVPESGAAAAKHGRAVYKGATRLAAGAVQWPCLQPSAVGGRPYRPAQTSHCVGRDVGTERDTGWVGSRGPVAAGGDAVGDGSPG